jgi:actin-related protein
MMNSDKEKYKEYFEILELEESASLADINQSFKKLKELYSSESMVTDPIEDEFSQEERQEIVNQLEEAYKALLSYIVKRDRVEKEAEKKEEEMADTAKEDDEEKEEEEEEEEEDLVLELDEEERIGDNEFQEEILPDEAFETITAPRDFSEEIGDMTVSVHENEYVHEHIHIELPEKEETQDENIQESAFEIVSTGVDEDIRENKLDKTKRTWDESLFEKDIEEIKEELTRDLTRDIKEELTMPQKEPGDEQAVKEGFEGFKIKGHSLRKVREDLGFGIHEVAVATKINYKILVNIEKERFPKLPDAGHLRWYLTTYAKALFLDPQKVADQYMKRFRWWKRTKGEL